MKEITLIDLSSLAHPIWHMAASDPNPNATSIRTIERVRALASGNPHVAICCDEGQSFRAEIDPQYKANRPERDASLGHQIALVKEQLVKDGFPVWSIRGLEADDLIASATKRALAQPDVTVTVVSADKDLLQLVGERVSVKSLRTGVVLDSAAVVEKFGVKPSQMCDFLSLVGDSADNVRGATGIGPKKAAALLQRFCDIETLYAKLDEAGPQDIGLKPSESDSLEEFRARWPLTRSLIALREDADIPFDDVLRERVAKDVELFGVEEEVSVMTEEIVQTDGSVVEVQTAPAPVVASAPAPVAAPAKKLLDDVLAATPAEWEKQLEPRSIAEARALAKDLHESRLFSAYGHPAAVLSTILAGRELGLQAMASLRAFHVIDGKPTLASDFLRALVLKSGLARYFRCSERTPERATFVTQRGDEPEMSLTYTVQEAQAAWSKGADAWGKSSWGKNPADMLVARAGAKLARLVYPEVVFGLYVREEFDNG